MNNNIKQAVDRRLSTLSMSEEMKLNVRRSFAQQEKPIPARRVPLRTAAIVLAVVVALAGVAYAVLRSQVADVFGWLYGGTWEREIRAGDIDAASQRYELGDVVYTVEEMVYKNEGDMQGLYGAVRITPAEGSNIVLLPQDYSVHDIAGYLLHFGMDEEIPDDALSYAELARQQGGKIILARLAVNGVYLNGVLYDGSIGESWLAQPDGSLLGALEIVGDGSLPLERAEQYELNLWVSNWEVTPEGDWLREDPENTWLQEEWVITIAPAMKGE